MKSKSRPMFELSDVASHMTRGVAYSLSQLAAATNISRPNLQAILDAAMERGQIDRRMGRSNSFNYFLGGSAPTVSIREQLPGAALRITVAPSTVSGSIDAYAESLHRHRALAMLTRA